MEIEKRQYQRAYYVRNRQRILNNRRQRYERQASEIHEKNCNPLTLEEIEASNKDILSCDDVHGVLKCNAYTLHQQAIEHPESLGFPVVVVRSRVKIPKEPFVAFMRGRNHEK